MRTAKIVMLGQEHLLCFSTGMVEAACERYGTIGAFFEALDTGTESSRFKTVIWAVASMMDAGAKYAKKMGLENPAPLSEEDIRDLCDVTELLNLREKIKETINNGSARQVEAEPPKNAETTPVPEDETTAH